MSELKVRPLKLLEVPKWLKWLWDGKEKNDLDARMFDYPNLKMVVCENSKQILILPFHPVYVIDSLAFNPEVTDAKERLDATLETVNAVAEAAKSQGMAELLYISSDDRTDESAARQLGFVKEIAYRKIL
jgi:hypothetical protein